MNMLTITPSVCLYACHMCKFEGGLYVNVKLHFSSMDNCSKIGPQNFEKFSFKHS